MTVRVSLTVFWNTLFAACVREMRHTGTAQHTHSLTFVPGRLLVLDSEDILAHILILTVDGLQWVTMETSLCERGAWHSQ